MLIIMNLVLSTCILLFISELILRYKAMDLSFLNYFNIMWSNWSIWTNSLIVITGIYFIITNFIIYFVLTSIKYKIIQFNYYLVWLVFSYILSVFILYNFMFIFIPKVLTNVPSSPQSIINHIVNPILFMIFFICFNKTYKIKLVSFSYKYFFFDLLLLLIIPILYLTFIFINQINPKYNVYPEFNYHINSVISVILFSIAANIIMIFIGIITYIPLSKQIAKYFKTKKIAKNKTKKLLRILEETNNKK